MSHAVKEPLGCEVYREHKDVRFLQLGLPMLHALICAANVSTQTHVRAATFNGNRSISVHFVVESIFSMQPSSAMDFATGPATCEEVMAAI